MNRLVVCAGGIDLSIDAKLLGSVRSLYEGDRTNGTAIMKIEAAFMAKMPEKDKLAALELYQKCVKEIMLNSYAITEETLNFRIWLTIPTDMRIELDNANTPEATLVQPGGFFSRLLYLLNITYRIARQKCEWHGFTEFNTDYRYYFAHGHRGELYPDNISVAKRLWSQHFVAGKFAFGGQDWSGDKLNSKVTPNKSDQLQSVENLSGKCVYVEITGSPDIGNAQPGDQLEKYGGDTLRTLELSHFALKLSNTFGIQMDTSNSAKLYHDNSSTVWQIQLPEDINRLRSH